MKCFPGNAIKKKKEKRLGLAVGSGLPVGVLRSSCGEAGERESHQVYLVYVTRHQANQEFAKPTDRPTG